MMAAEVNIPDDAYSAAENAVDEAHICDGSGCCYQSPRFSDTALKAAAPLIVAAELENLANEMDASGSGPYRITSEDVRARAAQLRGGAR